MFIALLINPLLSLYHIIVHAIFKSLLFLISGSLIHIHYHYQSIARIQSKHIFIKIAFIFGCSALILSLSKETIIYSSITLFSSIYIYILLIIGAIYTIIYSIIIYLNCFYFSSSIIISNYNLFYSFLIPFLVINSLLVDIILESGISLNIGSIFYVVDNGT